MADKVTNVKTNGQVTRPTMASGKTGGRNTLPRVSSVAGIKARAARRSKNHESVKADGFNAPGSMNPRKVGRG